jgi:magnesium-transporting ATPase (P-type)
MVLFLFNTVIYVFVLLCLCILIVCLCMATLTDVFPFFFLSCKANARVKTAKTGHDPHSSEFLCCSMCCLFCVILCIVCVCICTVLLPPGGNPIAVNKYINITNVFVTVQQGLACNDKTHLTVRKKEPNSIRGWEMCRSANLAFSMILQYGVGF